MTDVEMEAFLAVAHTKNFSKAAGELYISQSALSRRIKSLEDELGYQLFIRNKGIRTVELTNAGTAFVESATRWKALWGEMKDIGSLNNQTVLNISVINSVNAYVMPGFFHRFMIENPWIYLTIRAARSADTPRYVENGIVDIALLSDDSYIPNADMQPAYRETLQLVCRKDLEYPQEVNLKLLDVSKHLYMPWNREYEAWFKKWFPVSQRSRVWLDNTQLMEEFLLLNDYWTIMPASIAAQLGHNPELSIHTVQNGPPDRIIFYLLGKYQKKEASRLFLTYLDEHLRAYHQHYITSLIDKKALGK